VKYAALLTNNADDVAAWEQMSPEEAAAARAEEVPKWEALFGELGPTGVLGDGFELDSPKTAKTVRVRDGETIVTDGPYAETKEQIGGILILEANDLNHAIQLMSKHPGVRAGPFEIRPAADLTGMIRDSERRRGKASD
jgi:hypothetical protein